MKRGIPTDRTYCIPIGCHSLGVDYILAVVLAFIANEGISILENVGIMGVKYPEALKKALDVLTNKSQEQEGE